MSGDVHERNQKFPRIFRRVNDNKSSLRNFGSVLFQCEFSELRVGISSLQGPEYLRQISHGGHMAAGNGALHHPWTGFLQRGRIHRSRRAASFQPDQHGLCRWARRVRPAPESHRSLRCVSVQMERCAIRHALHTQRKLVKTLNQQEVLCSL